MSAVEHANAGRAAGGRFASMARWEVSSLARCAVNYPLGLVEAALTFGRPSGDTVRDVPVVLVHGYGHNRSGWFVLDRRLRRAGFTSVHTLNYWPVGAGVPTLAAALAARVEEIRDRTGHDRVHVVGHSLGGIILRWFAQEMGGAAVIDTAITLSSPHGGAPVARLAPERTAQDLRPGSWVLRRLDAGASTDIRWIAYYCRIDALVPGTCGRLNIPEAVNIEVPGHGHLSMLLSARVASSVTEQLEAAEGIGAGLHPIARQSSRSAATLPHVEPHAEPDTRAL